MMSDDTMYTEAERADMQIGCCMSGLITAHSLPLGEVRRYALSF